MRSETRTPSASPDFARMNMQSPREIHKSAEAQMSRSHLWARV